jgi:hypothetical protein
VYHLIDIGSAPFVVMLLFFILVLVQDTRDVRNEFLKGNSFDEKPLFGTVPVRFDLVETRFGFIR